MKKILFALSLLAFSISEAQLTAPYYAHSPRATNTSFSKKDVCRDSVSSSVTILAPTTSYTYGYVDSILLQNSYRSASILFVLTKVSGTVAGKVELRGSVDGLTWNYINDTLTLANSTTNTITWELPGRPRIANGGLYNSLPLQYPAPIVMPYLYYEAIINGTGTWCGTFYTAIVPRQ